MPGFLLHTAMIYLLIASSALALNKGKGSEDKSPALIEADTIDYDKNNSTVTASGNVEVRQGNKTLIADKVQYNKQQDSVEAKGNISFSDAQIQATFFADEAHFENSLKNADVTSLSARFTDGTLLSSESGTIRDEKHYTLNKSIYSPCPICLRDISVPPLWRLRSFKSRLNDETEVVTHNHSFLELYGIPVLYIPYFFHPAPGAKRKSGFLTFKYKADSVFGFSLTTPYYLNIAPNIDATITPVISSREAPLLIGEFRHLIESGEYKLEASGTNPRRRGEIGERLPGRDFRGHIEGTGRFRINDDWQWGFNAKRSTDDTYLRRYALGFEDVLTSRAYAQTLKGRNYKNIQALSFQGLNVDDDPATTPFILPEFNLHQELPTHYKNSKFAFDFNSLVLSRDEGVSVNRVALNSAYILPYVSKNGSLVELKASLRSDGYYVDSLERSNGSFDGFTGRIVPQAEAKWSLPLIKTTQKGEIVIEPVAGIIVSPYGGNPDKIPNEDSQDVEFADENLFEANRFSGFDRIEEGPRANYGIRGGVSYENIGDFDFVLGQSYRVRENSSFTQGSGLNDNLSDFVGRLAFNNKNFFNFSYRFRYDSEDYDVTRNNITTNLHYYDKVSVGMSYLFVSDDFAGSNSTNSEREAISLRFGANLGKSIKITSQLHRNIATNRLVNSRSSLVYKGKCVNLELVWLRDFTVDRDVSSGTTVSFNVQLKNLSY